jgi:hypothetical protein
MSSRALPAKYATVYITPKFLYVQRDLKIWTQFRKSIFQN